MPSNNLSVSVIVNFPGNATTPNWTVPPKLTVDHGDIDTIYWNLSNGNLPPGAASLMFATTNPIQFVTNKPNITDASAWTGGAPTRNSATQVQVTDDNTTQSGTKHYYYSVNVTTLDANGNPLQTYTYDPEVENVGN